MTTLFLLFSALALNVIRFFIHSSMCKRLEIIVIDFRTKNILFYLTGELSQFFLYYFKLCVLKHK